MLPCFALAQNKKVIHITRVFPKADRIDQFEKAITAHAQKFHKGDWAWRVMYVETGPDAGGYQLVEGPVSWTSLDGRGDLGQVHTDDWNKNVSIHLTDKTSSHYLTFVDSLSTGTVNGGTEKMMVTHTFPKVGFGPEYIDHLKKMKKAWEAGKQEMIVYQKVASGRNSYAIVNRLKDGFKELEDGYRPGFRSRYETANGPGSFETYLTNLRKLVNDETYTEILILQPKLGTPK